VILQIPVFIFYHLHA